MTSLDRTRSKSNKKRLFYLDLVRGLAAVIIVITHFDNPYLVVGNRELVWNEPFGIYIGGLGVSLFLIISGAALAYTYRNPIDLKRFYWKRFKGIYPMFWIAWIVATALSALISYGPVTYDTPRANIIFTVLGVDGLVANFHVPTFYYLGEWFLGFIIIFYLVFPLLLWAIDKFPVPTAVAIAVLYIGTYFLWRDSSLPTSILLPTRLPELAFGIYFMKYAPERLSPLVALPTIATLGVSTYFPTEIPEDIATFFVGASTFVLLVLIAPVIEYPPVTTTISFLAKYSYPIFLVHHVVIMVFFASVDTTHYGQRRLWLVLLALFLITTALSIVLDRVTNFVTKSVGQLYKRLLNA